VGALEPGADPPAGDLAGWAALLGQLYARRAGAYAAVDPAWLSDVYAPGSALLDRDRAQLEMLSAAGRTVAGFAPTVRTVTAVSGDGSSVVVDLVDEVPGYRVLTASADGEEARGQHVTGQEVTGRGPAEVRMMLRHTEAGWRIADASRVS
jgi:hypothetical protein